MIKKLALVLFFLTAAAGMAHADPVTMIVTAAVTASSMGAAVGIGVATYTLGQIIAMSLITAALTGAASLLTPKAKPVSQALSGITVSGFGSNNARTFQYGTTRVGGTVFFAHFTGTNNEYLHLCIAMCGHEVYSIDDVWFDDFKLTIDGSGNVTGGVDSNGKHIDYTGYAWVYKHLGADDQTVDTHLKADAPDVWDDSCRARGVAYLYVKLKANSNLFSQVPNISCLISGKKVYDPRTSTTAFSKNVALCTRDYLTDTRYGRCALDTEVDDTLFSLAANNCDETVTKADGTTEKRYEASGVLSTDTSPDEVLAQLTTAMAGQCPFVAGAFRPYAGVWRTPELTAISEADCIDKITVQTALARQDLINAIKGTYVSPDNNWQASDFPSIASETYKEQDGGERLWSDVTLAFTQSPSMAQRIAKITLLKARQPITVTLKCPLSLVRLMVGDIVPVNMPTRYGWSNKLFEVMQQKIEVVNDRNNHPIFAITLTLRETASEIYDWSFSEESVVDPAPNTNLPNPNDIPAPTGLHLESGTDTLFINKDGSVISRAKMSWNSVNWSSVVSGGYFDLQYKLSTESEWKSVGRAMGFDTSFYITPVQDGANYDFRIRSIGATNRMSDWAYYWNYTIIGKSQPPSTPTNFNVAVQSDGTRVFSWVPPTDADFVGCLIGYSADTSATFDAMTLLNDGALTSSPYETNQLGAGTYTFGIVAVDSSGNKSAPSYIVAAVLPDPRIAGAIKIIHFENSNWAGTLTNCFKDNNNTLLATTTSQWDSVAAKWDDWQSWQVNSNSPIVYESNSIDLGAVFQFRPLVSAVYNGAPTYQISYSTDGISWSSYVSTEGVFSARYAKIKITITGTTPALKTAQVIFSGNPITETLSNIDTSTIHTSAGVFRVPLTKSYHVITTVTVTIIGVGAGWSAVVMDKSTSGPLINIYNGSNSPADCTVDINVIGL